MRIAYEAYLYTFLLRSRPVGQQWMAKLLSKNAAFKKESTQCLRNWYSPCL